MSVSSQRALEERLAEERRRECADDMLAALRCIKEITEKKQNLNRFEVDVIWQFAYRAIAAAKAEGKP